MMKLVFATNNAHKLEEARAILKGSFEVVSLAEIGCYDDIPETATTLEGNALLKAQYVKEHFGLDCFADDTGLEVEALDGAPGVYSARYSEKFKVLGFSSSSTSTSDKNIDLLLHNLAEKDNRNARFRTAVALIYKGEQHLFEGTVEGSILHERHGEHGFGYDAIFRPSGFEHSFAEMSGAEKNTISHRGRALKALAAFLKE